MLSREWTLVLGLPSIYISRKTGPCGAVAVTVVDLVQICFSSCYGRAFSSC